MSSEWAVRRLGDVAQIVGGGTPSTKRAELWDGGIPWLTPKDLRGHGGLYVDGGERKISQTGLAESSARLLPAGAVVVSSRAPIGYVAVARRPLATNQGFRSLILKEGHVPEFFAYLLKTSTERLEAVASGSTFREITGTSLRELTFPIPPIDEQRRIAGVLGALDDKIEHNSTLQVRLRKLARVQLEHQMSQSEAEWPTARLADVFSVTVGGVWGADTNDGSLVAARVIRGIDAHDLAEGRLPAIPLRYLSRRQLERRLLSEGDVLIEASGSFCGRSAVVHRSWPKISDEPLTYSNFSKRLSPLVDPAIAIVVWLQLVRAYDAGEIIAFRTGSAFPNLDVRGLVAELAVRVPPIETARMLATIISGSLDTRLRLESRTLAAIRDALLPKLISGQIRVPESYDPEDVLGTIVEQAQAG